MNSKLLTSEQAYRAMFAFLADYYDLTKADDIGALLGSMNILADGHPVDGALWGEWQSAIEKVMAEHL